MIPLGIAGLLSLAAAGLMVQRTGERARLRNFERLESAVRELADHLQRVRAGDSVERAGMSEHLATATRALHDLREEQPGDLFHDLAGRESISAHDFEDLDRHWRACRSGLILLGVTSPDEPGYTVQVERLVPLLLDVGDRASRSTTLLRESYDRSRNLLAALIGLSTAWLWLGLGLVLWAGVRHRRRLAVAIDSMRVLGESADHAACGLVVTDAALRPLWSNAEFEALCGPPRGPAAEGSVLQRITPAADTSEARRALRLAIEKGGVFRREFTDALHDGGVRRLELRLRPVPGGTAERPHLIGVLLDVTERMESERAQRESLRVHREILTAMSDGFVMQGADGRIEMCNPAAERILGLTRDQMMGRSSLDPRWRSIHEDGSPYPGSEHPAMQALRTGLPQPGNIMGVHRPDGRLTWLRIDAAPLFNDGDPRPYAAVAIFTDVTARRQSEEAIRKLTRVVDQSPVGILITDASGAMEYVNPELERMTGYASSELLGRNPRVLASGETPRSTYESLWSEVKQGRDWRGLVRNRRRNAEVFWVDLAIFPLRNESGSVTHFVGMQRDIDEAKRREQELADAREAAAQEVQARAAFLQGMSRELLVPIESMQRTADDLLRCSLDPGPLAGLHSIRRTSDQLLSMIHQLFDLSWLDAEAAHPGVPFRLRALLREVIADLARGGRTAAELPELRIADDVPETLEGDAGALRQLLWALAGDAALDARGLKVEVRVDARGVRGARQGLRFEVRRHGTAMSAQRRAEIARLLAEPRAARSEAADLGPALAARLAVHLGGALEFASLNEECDVWRFQTTFAPADESVQRSEAWAQAAESPASRALVSDAESAARTGLRTQLEALGLAATLAPRGGDLAAWIGRTGGAVRPFDLVVVEGRDPDRDVFAELERVGPHAGPAGLPVLVLRSTGGKGDAERCRELGARGYLSMPFGDLDLAEAAAAVCRTPADGPLITRHWLREHRAPRRVLVVGEGAAAAGAARALTLGAYDVVQATSSEDALRRAAREHFDVVLADAQDADRGAPAMFARLRAMERAAALRPAVHAALGGRLDPTWVRSGVDAFVPVPVQMDVLLGVLQPLTGERPAGGFGDAAARSPNADREPPAAAAA